MNLANEAGENVLGIGCVFSSTIVQSHIMIFQDNAIPSRFTFFQQVGSGVGFPEGTLCTFESSKEVVDVG